MSITRVPVPSGLQSIPELPRLREAVYNMIRFGDALIPRPGIVQTHDGFGAARGSVEVTGVAHFIMGQQLIRLLQDGTTQVLGDVFGTGRLNIDQGLPGAVLVDSTGGSAYVLTQSSYQQITDSDFVRAQDVAYIDGYYVFVPLDGSQLFYSDIADPMSYDPANFFDAEMLPDRNVGVRNHRGDLYVMGEESTEVFRTTGDTQQPFARVGGAMIEIGLVAAHVEVPGSFAFIGKERDQDYGIFAIAGSSAQRISSPAVDNLLQEYSYDELRTAFANRFQHRSVDVVTWHLPHHTLAYYGDWAIFQTDTVGQDEAPWIASSLLFRRGDYLVATNDGRLGRMDGLQDCGLDFAKGFDTFIRSGRGANLRLSSLELDCLTGQEATDYRVGLELSDDGLVWGPRFWMPLGITGRYRQRICFQYPGGLGKFESFAGIRIRSTEPVTFAIEGMQAVMR